MDQKRLHFVENIWPIPRWWLFRQDLDKKWKISFASLQRRRLLHYENFAYQQVHRYLDTEGPQMGGRYWRKTDCIRSWRWIDFLHQEQHIQKYSCKATRAERLWRYHQQLSQNRFGRAERVTNQESEDSCLCHQLSCTINLWDLQSLSIYSSTFLRQKLHRLESIQLLQQ